MSRYTLHHPDPQHALICGWDGPLDTYFAQVFDHTLPEDAETICICWVGDTVGAIPTVSDLARAIRAYDARLTIPEPIREQLREDHRTSPVPTPLQRLLRSLT
jgi:hypothetical protein